MNKIQSITPYNFKGANYTVYGKQNKKVDYLYNKVSEMVIEHKVPAEFFLGSEDKIVLSPQTTKSKSFVQKSLNKLEIKFSKEKADK